MKRLKVILSLTVLLLFLSGAIFAQTMQYGGTEWTVSYGDWSMAAGNLAQRNAKTGLARIDIKLPQSGIMQYEFTVRYNAGGYKDMAALAAGKLHAGFGAHIGVDKAALGTMSWGNGRSYLLWLNLDTVVASNSKHYGFRAQVYKSTNNVTMDLMNELNVDIARAMEISLPRAIDMLSGYLAYDIPVKIVVNADNGEIKVYDPSIDPDVYGYEYAYVFKLDPAMLKGNFVSLRTNNLSAVFGNASVTKLR
jgi:hypothetical protein